MSQGLGPVLFAAPAAITVVLDHGLSLGISVPC